MTKNKTRPDDAHLITQYAHLRKYITAFAEGHLNLLILLGGPGLSKSFTTRQVVGNRAAWIEGNASAFGLYTELHRNQDRLIVIDDVDSLYSDKASVRLLKCLCQTDERKSLAWHSAAAGLDREGIPRQFHTKSRVIIIANDWRTLNENVSAVQDRGHTLCFNPAVHEVHREVGTWFEDDEVYAFFERYHHLIEKPSMRSYVRAAELRAAGMEWEHIVLGQTLSPKALMVARLKADSSYRTEEERARAFVASGGGCRATYFNHARKIRSTVSLQSRRRAA